MRTILLLTMKVSSMCSPNWPAATPWLTDMLFVNTIVTERTISSRQAHKASRAVPRIGNTPAQRPILFCTSDGSKLTWPSVDNRALFTSSRNWRRRRQSWRESVRRFSFLVGKCRCRIASDRLWHSFFGRIFSATICEGCSPVTGRRWFGDGGKDWHLELLLVISERCAAEGNPPRNKAKYFVPFFFVYTSLWITHLSLTFCSAFLEKRKVDTAAGRVQETGGNKHRTGIPDPASQKRAWRQCKGQSHLKFLVNISLMCCHARCRELIGVHICIFVYNLGQARGTIGEAGRGWSSGQGAPDWTEKVRRQRSHAPWGPEYVIFRKRIKMISQLTKSDDSRRHWLVVLFFFYCCSIEKYSQVAKEAVNKWTGTCKPCFLQMRFYCTIEHIWQSFVLI